MDVLLQMIESTLRVSTPLLLACLAGLFSERAGIFDIGLEGKLLAAAFIGAATAAVTGLAIVGLLAAVGIAVFLSLVHGFASITHRGNQIVSGVAINFVAAGATIILGQAWFAQGGRTPALNVPARFEKVDLASVTNFLDTYSFHVDFSGGDGDFWLALWRAVSSLLLSIWDTICWPLAFVVQQLASIDGFNRVFNPIFLGHYRLEYIAFLMVPFTWWVLYRTRFGLRLRAVGENPAAVDTAGISVTWLRYRAVICTGILVGMGGAFLSLAQSAGFVKDMSAGKGYIALAALIFAKWRPVPAMLACLLFGFLDAASIRFQGQEWPLVGRVPVQLVNALPFILTIILLAGFVGKAIPPRAGGVPYVKER